MLSLLLSTLEMMVLTFIIGFVVAGVIKLIAVWADSLEFHHNEEHSQFSKLNKLRAKIGEILGLDSVNEEEELVDDEREEFRQGVNSDLLHIKPSGYYHGVSHGASDETLLDYYYPRDTREFFLKEEERAHINKKNSKKPTANKQ